MELLLFLLGNLSLLWLPFRGIFLFVIIVVIILYEILELHGIEYQREKSKKEKKGFYNQRKEEEVTCKNNFFQFFIGSSNDEMAIDSNGNNLGSKPPIVSNALDDFGLSLGENAWHLLV